MKAYKYELEVGPDRRVVVELPIDAPQGKAEILVLLPDPQTRDEARDAFEAFLTRQTMKTGGRSKEDIDRELEAERNSWD